MISMLRNQMGAIVCPPYANLKVSVSAQRVVLELVRRQLTMALQSPRETPQYQCGCRAAPALQFFQVVIRHQFLLAFSFSFTYTLICHLHSLNLYPKHIPAIVGNNHVWQGRRISVQQIQFYAFCRSSFNFSFTSYVPVHPGAHSKCACWLTHLCTSLTLKSWIKYGEFHVFAICYRCMRHTGSISGWSFSRDSVSKINHNWAK